MRNSQLVKYALVLMAVALTAVLFWGGDRAPDPLPPDQARRPGLADVSGTEMVDPRFIGEDRKNRRWEVRAAVARQISADLDVELVDVRAKASDGENALVFQAGQGLYSKTDKRVNLSGGVWASGMGYTLSTTALAYDLEAQTGASDGTVEVQGPRGDLRAARVELSEAGNRLVLSGGVTARLLPKTNLRFRGDPP
jgi:LPS export ABC transporter protein LptC